MKRIPFQNLQFEYLSIKEEIDSAINGVLQSGQYILGPNVMAFEDEIARYCECRHAVAVASGTDALLLALMALGVGEGDEIITTSFSFVATASVIARLGCIPVFVDVDRDSFNIDANKIEMAITSKTKAIIPVHLFGKPANFDEIRKIADKYNLLVVEDVAQAIGAKYKGKSVGSLGSVGALSFFPSKNLGAVGDGGAVITNDSDISDKVNILRRHGARKKYYHEILGINSRLDELQAAILRVKLRYVTNWNKKRIDIAKKYNSSLNNQAIVLPINRGDNYEVYHQYSIRVLWQRDAFQKYMFDHGVETMIYYPYPLHLQPVFSPLGYKLGDFPISESISKQIISLPCYPELSMRDVERICALVNDWTA